MLPKNLDYWLGFSIFEGIGPIRFKQLYQTFGSVEKAWLANESEFKSLGFSHQLVQKFISFRNQFVPTEVREEIERKQIQVLTQDDTRYPKLLKQIHDPPIVLYVRGNIDDGILGSPSLGVVGTRKINAYGEEVTNKLTLGLINYGLTITSGLAYGVDTVAHTCAVENGGKTIAVLGCGIDIIYPYENKKLYWDIIHKSGVIVSEFPPGRLTLRGLFPSRNRIISGLSLGTLVTQGAANSGSLITARCALEQGREVFAVPGPITSLYSDGPTALLKDGAKLVTKVEDIIEELDIPKHKKLNVTNEEVLIDINEEEKKIIQFLSQELLHFDDLVHKCGITSSVLANHLTQLELEGFVKHFDDGTYGIAS